MKIFRYFIILFLFIGFVTPASASGKCEGPVDTCAQLQQLQEALAAQKALTAKAQDDKAQAEVKETLSVNNEKTVAIQEKVAAVQDVEKKTSDKSARIIAFAAALAIGLKLLIGVLISWKGFFQTDKSKAWLKVGLVSSGFLVFISTNVGFGIPWWQAVILAGGGPGSILVHELSKVIPVLLGKKKYSDIDPNNDPTVSQ